MIKKCANDSKMRNCGLPWWSFLKKKNTLNEDIAIRLNCTVPKTSTFFRTLASDCEEWNIDLISRDGQKIIAGKIIANIFTPIIYFYVPLIYKLFIFEPLIILKIIVFRL